MAAAPQRGAMLFVGQSGKTYSRDLYVSDVDKALVTFDIGVGAGSSSPDFTSFPEPGYISDIMFVTGLTDTATYRLIVNSSPTEQTFHKTVHDDGVERPNLRIGIKAGARIQLLQHA